MKHRFVYFAISVGLLGIFALFTLVVRADALEHLDFSLMVKLQDHISAGFNPIFGIFEFVGRFELTFVALVIILAWTRDPKFAFFAFLIFVSLHFVEIIGKIFLHQPPPPFMFFRLKSSFTLPSSYAQAESSYPSGHAMRSIYLGVMYFGLWFGKKKRSISGAAAVFVLCIGIPTFIGLSKVMLGQHWPTDIAGGLLLGASLGFFALALVSPKQKSS